MSDGAGGTDTVTVEVTVEAVNDAPVIAAQATVLSTPEETPLAITLADLIVADIDNTYPDDFTILVGDGDNYTHDGATITPALDFNGELTVPVRVNDGTTDSNSFGSTVTVTAVNDVPTLSLVGDAAVTVECGAGYSDAGATAADVEDGDLTASIAVGGDTVDTGTPATYTITFDVTDSQGGAAAQVTRTVTVEDTTAPEIALTGEASVTIECGAGYSDAGATAADVCDGDLTASIVSGGDTVDTGTPGTYTITYDVSDAAGNAAVQVTRVVTVEDTTAPEIALTGEASVDHRVRRRLQRCRRHRRRRL